MAGFCTLANVKIWLDLTGTTQDAKLQLFIDDVSAKAQMYLGYTTKRATYTNEVHSINNLQYLYLDAPNIQAVSAVSLEGATVAAGTGDEDYQFSPTDAKAGRLYRGVGWCGRYFARDMTYDPVAGARVVLVSYTAGWYYPDDANYSKGSFDSVPAEISSACEKEVVAVYRKNASKAEGLTSFREGGMSWSWDTTKSAGFPISGLSDDFVSVLNGWKRWGIA